MRQWRVNVERVQYFEEGRRNLSNCPMFLCTPLPHSLTQHLWYHSHPFIHPNSTPPPPTNPGWRADPHHFTHPQTQLVTPGQPSSHPNQPTSPIPCPSLHPTPFTPSITAPQPRQLANGEGLLGLGLGSYRALLQPGNPLRKGGVNFKVD